MILAGGWGGHSDVLRAVLLVAVATFVVWQVVRLRRGLQVFQAEGYKARRYLAWCRSNRRKALFVSARPIKKPLASTGRAWRILILATALSLLVLAGGTAAIHLFGGGRYDGLALGVAAAAAFLGTAHIVVAADRLLHPLQDAINARYVRAARHKLAEVDPLVVGVTGSFGKTSTKSAIAGLLGPPSEALATPGSFNTPLGVCRTINEQLVAGHRVLVVEMGAYGEGEIADLCRLVRPRIGVLTSIGPAHLERFGSLDAIRRAKYELIESLPDDGVAIMNVDDPEVRALAESTERVRVVRYGLDASAAPHVTARRAEVTAVGTVLEVVDTRTGEELEVRTRLLGRHSIGHVLAGVSVALEGGRRLDDLGPAIGALAPVEHRLQLMPSASGVTIIDDAYNSNPRGAAAALEVLAAMPARRRIVVTPGMVELGGVQLEANRELGRHAARVADAVIVVAATNRDAILAGAAEGGCNEVRVVDSLEGARQELASLLHPGDVVLFENDLPDHLET